MQPKIKNATFATACNPYQNTRYNSEHSNPNLLPIGETFGFVVFLKDVK